MYYTMNLQFMNVESHAGSRPRNSYEDPYTLYISEWIYEERYMGSTNTTSLMMLEAIDKYELNNSLGKFIDKLN